MKRKHLLAAVAAALIVAGGSAAALHSLVRGLPSVHTLEDYTPSLASKIYDHRGRLITELFTERRTLTHLKDIPVDLQNAVLSAEDDRFFEHWGISPRGIMRAALSNLIKRRVAQGGSTITQQLAKTIFLTPERTIGRKLREMVLTLQLERNYTKEEILQMYLNQIYFGSGAYGIDSAARIYFSKPVKDLDLAECALLAGLPRAPSYYSPLRHPERARSRRAVVLRRMRELGYITGQEEEEANAEPVVAENRPVPATRAPYFVEYVRQQLEPVYGSEALYRGGLSIYTTLDIDAQKAAEDSLEKVLSGFDAAKHAEAEKRADPAAEDTEDGHPARKVQGALLALDPKTGGIRAMVGGRDFGESQFNRAVQARRQPGSCFKPFIYTAAIENGFTPASVLQDTPLVYVNNGRNWQLAARTTDYLQTLPPELVDDPMKVWTPQNYSNRHRGKVLLRGALEGSLNTCAVSLLEEVGPLRAIDYARRMGIASPLTNTLSLALGASGVTLLEVVNGMAVLDSGGIYTRPYAVTRVEDKNGRILEENMPEEREVLSPQTSYIMTNLLKGVVENGTGRGARALGRPAAGKTGTTNNFSDAWFIGFTPQLVAGVWVGYDDMKPLGNRMTGGRVACPIWTGFMKEALRGEPVLDFAVPDGIVFSLIDPKTGLLALSTTPGAYLEAFVKGTEPKDYCFNAPEEPEDADMGASAPEPEEEEGF